tara:strand:- start:7813 stop:7992 length:180 start_codon:yes stop_codon:yes gene_type:complete
MSDFSSYNELGIGDHLRRNTRYSPVDFGSGDYWDSGFLVRVFNRGGLRWGLMRESLKDI